ncbi:hypothetical protein ccbrp13_32340 [Ktedonobacteria bacterium brp13]|nr:hypothetical protein ccbrp13_32340 [Ktedonobacteria bacterium brp13]
MSDLASGATLRKMLLSKCHCSTKKQWKQLSTNFSGRAALTGEIGKRKTVNDRKIR